ncbi:MAG: PstS family phosphate ABC transporter substrate-binding protein [Cyanobacteria bacterium P01_F01_bin.150]
MAENGTLSLLNRFAVVAGTAAASLGFIAPAALAEVVVDGSSTVFPITEAMAEEYGAETGTNVVVGVSGTGGGFKKFCVEDGTDISNASRPIKPSEMAACAEAGVEYIEIPVAYDALTVVTNPSNTWATEMTVDQLNRLWDSSAENEATTWADLDPSWPADEIELYGPGADSGTFDYFVEEVMGDGDSRADYTASEDDNVLVIGVSGDVNALGYFGLAYYVENADLLNAVAIDNGDGPVLPSDTTVNNGTYSPFSRPIFIYVNKASLADPDVAGFVDYYISNAPTIVPDVDYVALPTEIYSLSASLIDAQTAGTVFRRNDGVELAGQDLIEILNLSRTLDAPAE